jgi:hypothetical protein
VVWGGYLSELLGDYTQVLIRKGITVYQYYEVPYCEGSVSFDVTRKERRKFGGNSESVITNKTAKLNVNSFKIAGDSQIEQWFTNSDVAIIINFYDENYAVQYTRTITNIEFESLNINWKNKEFISLSFSANGIWN